MHKPFESRRTTQTASATHAFDAHYEEKSAARAERAFLARSIREVRPGLTFGPPAFLAIVVAAGTVFDAPGWFLLTSGILLAGSVLAPLLLYVAKPLAAARLARRHPVRHIVLTSQAISISAQSGNAFVYWSRIERVWLAEGHLLLVLGKFEAISIPAASLPAGALEFIRSSCKGVT